MDTPFSNQPPNYINSSSTNTHPLAMSVFEWYMVVVSQWTTVLVVLVASL